LQAGRSRDVRAAAHFLGATAVVLQIKDERILELAGLLQLRDHPRDALVYAINHRRIHLHAAHFPGFVRHGRPVPVNGRQFGVQRHEPDSMSYQWLGERFQHVRYSAEVDKSHPNIKYTVPYRNALFATLTLSAEDGLKITGRRSKFVGPSTWELGMEEVKGTSRDKDRLVPWISGSSSPIWARVSVGAESDATH
jgi:hypothetical protein